MYSDFHQKRGSLPSCWVDPCESENKGFVKRTDFDLPAPYVAAATYPPPATFVPPSEAEEEGIISALRSFASNTTAHGPKLITLSRTTSVWLSWGFIFLTAFCVVAAVFMAVEVTNIAFFSNKIESTIRVERAPLEGKPLPTVVLCNTGIFDINAANALELNREMLSYLVASMLGPLFITKGFEKDTARRTSLEAALRPVLARHGNMIELITKLSYKCEDLIMQCYNVMLTLPGPQCCQKLFQSTITPIGVCYRSDFERHFAQVMPGEGMGINIDLHVPEHTEAGGY
ncbi:uncharacterized protein LOC119588115 [Penaeus monodon]|uniref:uncharacterized protein LOC119588115 n=1 Tax=Penaeus monodon TaxID=6687 RepID=UPI0018A7D80C|nr:uncharacterized protein LOC119588115 [Penaeus monodon]